MDMRRAARRAAALGGALLAGLGLWSRGRAQPPPDGVEYREMRSGGRRWQVVRLDLRRVDLRMYWKDDVGRAFESFSALDRWLGARGTPLLAATNAGIFYRTREPAGLHVERGRELRPLNRSATPPAGEKPGNFFYLPNGVFYVSADGTAHVVDAARAAPRMARMREATQSGPLLLSAGRPHWLAGRADVVRNAVAVCAPHEVALVEAPAGASVREMALFIRDTLHCPDALYLDGTISGLWVPSARVRQEPYPYVGMLGVTAKR